ncbi:MAG TPA: hypothetical protein V6C65_31215, partial [Allocoleopsis sp.]
SGSMTLYKATEQGIGVRSVLDPTLGWQDFVSGSLEIQEIPGDHLGMLQEPSAKILGKALQSSLYQLMGVQ